MAMGWLNVLINNDLYDDLFAKKWTDAPFLVCSDVEPSGYEVHCSPAASARSRRACSRKAT